MPPPGRL